MMARNQQFDLDTQGFFFLEKGERAGERVGEEREDDAEGADAISKFLCLQKLSWFPKWTKLNLEDLLRKDAGL